MNLTILLAAFKEGFQFLGNQMKDMNSQLKKLELPDIEKLLNRQAVVLARSVDAMSHATKNMTIKAEVELDHSALASDLQGIKKAIELKEILPTDVSNLEAGVKLLHDAVQTNTAALTAAIAALAPALKKQKLEIGPLKLDDMQLRALSANRGLSTNPGPIAPRNVTLANVSMTTANTEYSYPFPANTVGWELRVRDVDVPLLVAYETGKLPTSGDGSAYFTIPAYYIQEPTGLDWGGKTLYMQTGSASQVAELIVYRA